MVNSSVYGTGVPHSVEDMTGGVKTFLTSYLLLRYHCLSFLHVPGVSYLGVGTTIGFDQIDNGTGLKLDSSSHVKNERHTVVKNSYGSPVNYRSIDVT